MVRRSMPGFSWAVTAGTVGVAGGCGAVAAWAQGVVGAKLLSWSAGAGAAGMVASLVADAAAGRRARLRDERLEAARISAAARAELGRVLRPLSLDISPVTGESPASLLRAGRAVVDFTGRRPELLGLRAWAHGSSHGVVRLVTGPGGAGKTRLAVHFAGLLETAGWRVGLLEPGAESRVIAALEAAGTAPALVVVDYAEARPDLSALLQDVARRTADGSVVRLMLLAREPGAWWHELHQEAAARDILTGRQALVELEPLSVSEAGKRELFEAAKLAFAARLGVPVPTTSLKSVTEGTGVLMLHTAALTAVLHAQAGHPATSVEATMGVVGELLGHERKYWTGSHDGAALAAAGVGARVLQQVVAMAGLLGARNRQAASTVVRRVPALADAPTLTVEAVVDWLRALYPPAGASFLGSLEPDLLLEYLVVDVLTGADPLPEDALDDLGENEAVRAMTVMARTMDHFPGPAQDLLCGLLARNSRLLVWPALRLARALDDPLFSGVLARVLDEAPLEPEILAALGKDLIHTTPSLAVVTVVVFLRIGAGLVATEDFGGAFDAAQCLVEVGDQLIGSGSHEIGLNVRRAALDLYRSAHEAGPEYRAEVAFALAGYAAVLSELDRHRDALPVRQEAVSLWRSLERDRPAQYRVELARASANLGITLNALGRYSDAQAAKQEAVGLWRSLERDQPDRYRAELARALANLPATLNVLGRHTDALTAIQEAEQLWRELERDQPGQDRSQLALTLTTLAVTLIALGRQWDALPAMQEAVELWRQLEHARPARYRHRLALALTNLGATLNILGQDGQPMAQEAVQLWRQLEREQPGLHRGELARALGNLGAILKTLGRERIGLPIVQEAIDLRRQLEREQPGLHRGELARALGNLGAILNALGRERDALPVIQEAVSLWREQERSHPGQHRVELAGTLGNLASTLTTMGREQEGLPVIREAVGLWREQERSQPGRYRDRLARALTAQAATLRCLGHSQESLKRLKEAVRIYQVLAKGDPAHNAALASALLALSGTLLNLGRSQEAYSARREAEQYALSVPAGPDGTATS